MNYNKKSYFIEYYTILGVEMKIDFGYRSRGKRKKRVLINAFVALVVATMLISEIPNLNSNTHNMLVLLVTLIAFLVLQKFDKLLDKRKKGNVKRRKIDFKYSFRLREILVVVLPMLYFYGRNELGGDHGLDILFASIVPLYIIIKFNIIKTILTKYSYNNMTMIKVDKMNGEEFETFLESLFDNLGYRVFRTQLSGDFGADLVLENTNEKVVVQAKRYSKNVGVSAVQEVVTAKKYYECNKAFVVTNSFYTRPAKDLAKVNKVRLYDRDWLEDAISKTKRIKKGRQDNYDSIEKDSTDPAVQNNETIS